MNNSFPSAFVNKFSIGKYYETTDQTSKIKYSLMSDCPSPSFAVHHLKKTPNSHQEHDSWI